MNSILVIDDDPLVREIVRHTLAKAGWRVHLADHGRAGVDQARHRPPSLILCDVKMEGGDGYTALAELRANATTRAIPFILMSAQADVTAQAKGRGLGADDYLVKPFGVRDLLAIVGKHQAGAA